MVHSGRISCSDRDTIPKYSYYRYQLFDTEDQYQINVEIGMWNL